MVYVSCSFATREFHIKGKWCILWFNEGFNLDEILSSIL